MAQVVLVGDMAFGDCSKGATVDAFTRHLGADLIVRYNGGCQCSHAVVLEDGRNHLFSQFGAGMLANCKVRTHLSRFMLVEPFSMMREAEALGKLTDNVWGRTTVDGNAVIVTPFHRYLNRLREYSRGARAHGSCGRGIGVAREMQLKYGQSVLMVKDVLYRQRTIDKLQFLLEQIWDEAVSLDEFRPAGALPLNAKDCEVYAKDYAQWPVRITDALNPTECMVFEGAQGVMLDEKHGTAPHNTWTNTTFENADTLLDEACVDPSERIRIGCFRTYYTRHGAGPFPTEDNTLDVPEPHNGNDGFQGKFRVGHFDYTTAKKAIDIVHGVDYLSLSHLDYLPRLKVTELEFLEKLDDHLGVPVGIIGRGPTAAHRTIKRNFEVTA